MASENIIMEMVKLGANRQVIEHDTHKFEIDTPQSNRNAMKRLGFYQ